MLGKIVRKLNKPSWREQRLAYYDKAFHVKKEYDRRDRWSPSMAELVTAIHSERLQWASELYTQVTSGLDPKMLTSGNGGLAEVQRAIGELESQPMYIGRFLKHGLSLFLSLSLCVCVCMYVRSLSNF
eukprot:TRINITY_DN3221_c0_g2_i1.p1 TRINITY_DN3221_c0_g2~~TRINITY_DN3221_c0_g2_i1.p1  ORF type:complete len:135 (-),score=20.06 TRINITY_DN3221_c0_g2_i1:226-609(-)